MKACADCGRETRMVIPVLRVPAPTFREALEKPVPRSCLSPEADSKIPWGEHPDDDRFSEVCSECAELRAGGAV